MLYRLEKDNYQDFRSYENNNSYDDDNKLFISIRFLFSSRPSLNSFY